MEKISEVRQNIEKGEKFMDLYEIPFSEVIITLGMHHIEKLEILQLNFYVYRFKLSQNIQDRFKRVISMKF